MHKKIIYLYLFLFLYQFGVLRSDELIAPSSHEHLASDRYVQSLASLIFYSRDSLDDLSSQRKSKKKELDKIQFSKEDVENLWDKISYEIQNIAVREDLISHLSHFEKAFYAYENYRELLLSGLQNQARRSLISCMRYLRVLWQHSLEGNKFEKLNDFNFLNAKKINESPNFNNNPYLTTQMKQKIHPYLLPLNHPMHSILDSMFSKRRLTKDKKTFATRGFKTIATGPRSYIQVAEHRKLTGYLVKAYLDTELKKKEDKESWEWLVLRCEGANKIRTIIKQKKIKYFIVADKWIYCLPPKPSPPHDAKHTHHYAILLAKNMQLTSEKRNYRAWLYNITKDHLIELYQIISRAQGSSYRPDNIAYTKNGKFAFIDTEYPSKGPDFKSIRPYLNSEMRAYWDKLVRRGGA